MSDPGDGSREPGEADVRMAPARELLRVIGDLLVELMAVRAAEASEEQRGRAALLRRALAEVTVRVARCCPAASPTACTCGEAFATAEDLEEHLDVAFVPRDDIGLDGRAHAELATARASESHRSRD